jgi:tRNA uridine 5-carboxymethylaminomethyl modification enzyme
MFTSRAEYRLLLREDNADLRLTEIAHKFGLISERRWRAFNEKREQITKEQQRLQKLCIHPQTAAANEFEKIFGKKLEREYSAMQLLARPEVNYQQLTSLTGVGPAIANIAAAEQVMIQIKYAGYIARQEEEIARIENRSRLAIPSNFDYSKVSGLSTEVQQKLIDVKPTNIGQASRISGVTPAAISLLLVYIKKAMAKPQQKNNRNTETV